MKWLFIILCFVYLYPAFAQDDFLSVYHKIRNLNERQKILEANSEINVIDSTTYKASIKKQRKFLSDSIAPLTKQIINLSFPDINFTGIENKAYSISDFSGKEVIVNYNYLYCQGCLNRIDSTLKRINNNKVKFIVLFLEQYQKEIDDLKNYGDNVLIGFINEDTGDLISLGLGDNAMYYLDGNRQIIFFDKTEVMHNEIAWNNFLKMHNK